MHDAPNSDVNLNVLGTGCFATVGAGCGGLVIAALLVSVLGVQAAMQGYAVPLLSFITGLLGHLTIGYITARAARANNATVNFHVILIGAFVMLLGLLAWTLPQRANGLSEQTQSLIPLLRIVSWLLTIPVMLLGASWSAEEPN